MSSDSEFGDEDDEIVLRAATQALDKAKSNLASNPLSNGRITEADEMKRNYLQKAGELAIMKAKLEEAKLEKRNEMSRLKDEHEKLKAIQDETLESLKLSLQKLEDENKFLNNEVKSLVHFKKRKMNTNDSTEESIMDNDAVYTGVSSRTNESAYMEIEDGSVPREEIYLFYHNASSDSSSFAHYIGSYCLCGGSVTSFDYLGRIYLDEKAKAGGFCIESKTPINSAIGEYILLKKRLRLDEMVTHFVLDLVVLIKQLLEKSAILSVPFLISLIHAAVSFKTTAVSKDLLLSLIKSFSEISLQFAYLLDSSQDIDDYINYYDQTQQSMLLEKFTLICSLDVLETAVLLSSSFGENFQKEIWNTNVLDLELFNIFLPVNTERFKSAAQINIVQNLVQMIACSISDTGVVHATAIKSNDNIINRLLKIFLIELPIKEDFLFYGLNRFIGNNVDFKKIEQLVPAEIEILHTKMTSTPAPISEKNASYDVPDNLCHDKFEINFAHEEHLLYLRLEVANFLECYILHKGDTADFQTKEHIKSIVRTIGIEQLNIIRSPRSKVVHYRIEIIAKLVRILSYVSLEAKGLTNTIFPETLYELMVVFSRIAFGSNSLAPSAQKILKDARINGYSGTVFNEQCEERAREIHHISYQNMKHNENFLAEVESEVANGLEFSYDTETIELSREILELCMTQEEADNLYFTMRPKDHTDKSLYSLHLQ